MLLHFKKSNEILETWSPHCKNLAFKDPPSLNFHNRTDASAQGNFSIFGVNKTQKEKAPSINLTQLFSRTKSSTMQGHAKDT